MSEQRMVTRMVRMTPSQWQALRLFLAANVEEGRFRNDVFMAVVMSERVEDER